MSIESDIKALTEALTENTKALREVLAASTFTAPVNKPEPVNTEPAKKKATKKAKKTQEEATEEAKKAAEEKFPNGKYQDSATDEPTKVETPAEQKDNDGWDKADSDEDLIREITETVKSKLMAADDKAAMKDKWIAEREKFGVEKISELKGETAKLREALAAAEAL